ncbi:alkyl hydroperoxide reductase subunit F [Shewanella sp. SW36]|uniref:alkyl hydroperoxide reductase subunit F n=1 Tax=Shewanella TaxID=22 RepID=UPI0015644B5F|nr:MULTISPECIES: alkyl hydroperoxide reductase subunit F [unclassified Shewanella]MCU7976005.1 alkyl hydroperoxide reductase subunit F [Shewanella sp. SW36]MCU7991395.1 alkyl hydroperoxide reductase subunit F [Shewanella sp. SW1]MCU8016638.1 alkyl hydroperoxide reductase subunit F [Shewanella sp. SM72]MCU8052904.1 alkyl hydroperoxide reductase subunit F [Shewanella sp. SM43]MCU8082793.1 alkyl hydroperoxide reductase subunit F [Shewanella sp. SM23]
MLDANLKNQLQTYLQNLKRPVELVVSADESRKSQELKSLAQDIVSLSSLVSLKEVQGERIPAMTVINPELNTQISFAGLPMGHEFTSLVLALLHTGGHPIKLSDDIIEQIRNLPGKYAFETYVSLTCQNCPDVVQALNMMAAINPNITNVMIDGALFQEEVTSKNIMAVPSVYLNGEVFAAGRISIGEILNKLDTNAASRKADEINEKAPFEVLVVGGGPAGAAAAIYAARKGLRTGIVADKFGGQVAETVGIENFISVKATEGPKLVANLEAHVRDYEVDIMDNQKAVSLGTDGLFELELASGAKLRSRTVLLATGARWREMNVPGEKEYRGKGVAYCPHCDGPLFKGKRVAVIGGGNSGIEAAIDLANIVEHVTVLEFDKTLRADDVLQRKAASMGNIKIITQAMTTEVTGDGTRVNGLNYTDRATGESHHVALAGIFVQIGLVPNAEWLKGTIDLTPRGEIIVDERGQTSVPGIFAAGDVTNSPFKQIIIAMGSGATASLGAFDYLIRHSDEETAATKAA